VGKVLVWAVIVLAVMMVARLLGLQKTPRNGAGPGRSGASSGSASRSGTSSQASSKTPAAKTPKELEHMVRCEHCQIYLPRSEALMAGGHIFCSRDHAERGVSPVSRPG
jgi:uncharacterized protein